MESANQQSDVSVVVGPVARRPRNMHLFSDIEGGIREIQTRGHRGGRPPGSASSTYNGKTCRDDI